MLNKEKTRFPENVAVSVLGAGSTAIVMVGLVLGITVAVNCGLAIEGFVNPMLSTETV